MVTAVDHLIVGVADVAKAAETYRSLGFAVRDPLDARNETPEAAYVAFGDFFLEFRAIDDLRPSTGGVGASEVVRRIVLRSDDLDAEITRLRSHGLRVTDPVVDPLDGVDGSLSRRSAIVDSIIPVGFVENQHPAAEREAFLGSATTHPNTASVLERIYVAVESIDREMETFEQLVGLPAPEPELGTVIMSLMSVFYLEDVGVSLAEPRAPGPTADALKTNGPGVFQVLFRAEHLDLAGSLMIENNVPAPARGTRLSGESALLVAPADACGMFVGLAGLP